MKRATPTPNRFIISTRSWPAKGLTLFFILLLLVSCDDDLNSIGSKKPISRFKVTYKEFDIPVTTVQADSVLSTIAESSGLICGNASDPNFGSISSNMYLQFLAPKIDPTGKSNFVATSLTLRLLLNYYVYGDTSNMAQNFSVHKISPSAKFSYTNEYFTSSEIPIEPDQLASGFFQYKHDSIKDHIARNTDTDAKNNRYDTLIIELPPQEYGQLLLDTAIAKGLYSLNKITNKWEFNSYKTDSVFRIAFQGLAMLPGIGNNRIMGFNIASSYMTLKYSYLKDGSTLNSYITYSPYDLPSCNTVSYNRMNTQIASLDKSTKYQDFDAGDDYCYLQSGTGLYAKLDLTPLHAYFDANPDTIINMGINSAEIVVDAEPDETRHHLSIPSLLYLRVVKDNNRFFDVPYLSSFATYDPQYAAAYYCTPNKRYLDVLSDVGSAGAVTLNYAKATTTNRQIYSAYVTEFIENLLRTPKGFSKVNSVALIPANNSYGKSLYGLTFKKDKVKLRVYYTKAL